MLYRFLLKDRSGLMDAQGRAVAPCGAYDAVGWPSEGLVSFEASGRWGYLDEDLQIAIPPTFKRNDGFQGGLAQVSLPNPDDDYSDLSAVIDRSGAYVLSPRSAYIHVPVTGPIEVTDRETGSSSLFTRSGEHIGTWQATGGSDAGLSLVRDRGLWGAVTEAGEVVLPFRFEGLENPGDGLIVREGAGGRKGYIDHTGEWVIEPRFDRCEAFSGGVAPVAVGGRFGVIDRSGAFIVEPEWAWIRPFCEGRAIVRREGLEGIMAPTGQLIEPPRHPNIRDYVGGLARIGEAILVDAAGERVAELDLEAACPGLGVLEARLHLDEAKGAEAAISTAALQPLDKPERRLLSARIREAEDGPNWRRAAAFLAGFDSEDDSGLPQVWKHWDQAAVAEALVEAIEAEQAAEGPFMYRVFHLRALPLEPHRARLIATLDRLTGTGHFGLRVLASALELSGEEWLELYERDPKAYDSAYDIADAVEGQPALEARALALALKANDSTLTGALLKRVQHPNTTDWDEGMARAWADAVQWAEDFDWIDAELAASLDAVLDRLGGPEALDLVLQRAGFRATSGPEPPERLPRDLEGALALHTTLGVSELLPLGEPRDPEELIERLGGSVPPPLAWLLRRHQSIGRVVHSNDMDVEELAEYTTAPLIPIGSEGNGDLFGLDQALRVHRVHHGSGHTEVIAESLGHFIAQKVVEAWGERTGRRERARERIEQDGAEA